MHSFLITCTFDGSASCGHNLRFTGFLGSRGLKEIPWPPEARNGPKTPEKWISRSWGPFWAKRPPTKFDRMLNEDPVNPVWGSMCPWGPQYGCFGEVGGHFVGWGPVFVGYGPNRKKTFGPENNVEFFFSCSANEPIFVENGAILAPDAPYRGRAH